VTYRDPPWIPIADAVVNKALDVLRQALMELARDHVFRDVTVTLPNATAVQVRHGLGRGMRSYALGAPTGALATGRLVEMTRDFDSVTFTATGYGATVSVPVRFW
jgi:hypothetical protein